MPKRYTALFVFILLIKVSFAQTLPAYLDPKFSTEERVNDLVSKLTLDHKIKLLQYRGTAIKTGNLDIPAYNWWNECLHGVARAGRATVFPQAIGLSASWNISLIGHVATAISSEARAKYDHFTGLDKRGMYQGLNFWTPNINIFRDPRWGRGMETYGEDPFLTGKMATSFIKGLQGDNPNYFKTIATVKHFAVHSGPERSRHRFNAEVSDRDFFETYTPAFKMAIQEGGVYSLMCAYNSFRGKPCCGSSYLLEDILRKRWGFSGFIVSDCGAVDDFFMKGTHEIVHTPEEAAALAIKAGVNLECGDIFNALAKAVEKRLVTETELDIAIKRLFTARFKLGMFDKKEDNPFSDISYDVIESTKHVELSLQAAKESIVLLKNSNALLPLSMDIKTIAVIGPNANDEEVMLANYNGFPSKTITPLQGIRDKIPGAKVLYAKGSAHVTGAPSLDVISPDFFFLDALGSDPGLRAKYYGNINFKGEPVISRVDQQIDFNWMDKSPIEGLSEEDFSATWSGYIKVPISGMINFNMFGGEEFELLIDGKTQFTFSSIYSPGYKSAYLDLKKGEVHKIDIKYASRGANAQLRLSWDLPSQDLMEEALTIAGQSDVVIMFMGLSPRLEGEEMDMKLDGFDGGDRTKIDLPQVQQDLIKEVKALGKPVVLVLLNGGALGLKWEDENLSAILEAWYGGQKGGQAIADVLFGDYNPSGKLPVTFYASVNDLPAFDNYDMTGRTYKYFNGTPVYQFGHGLSYTTFTFDKLKIKRQKKIKNQVDFSVEVKNTGDRVGSEVVQVYLRNLDSTIPAPLISLKAFQKIHLNKGEKKTVDFSLKPSDFAVIGANGDEIISPGRFVISVGGGQPGNNAAKVILKEIRIY